VQRTCYPSKSGQLTERGLSPLKIGSLVGCSPRELLIKTLFDGVGAARIEGNFA
jgi:hypothetical protein